MHPRAAIDALRVFVIAMVGAGVLDMYVLQKLKAYARFFSTEDFSETNLRWARGFPPARYLLGERTLDFMKSRTLRFPALELAFGVLAAISVYLHGMGPRFIRDLIFLMLGIPLAAISWNDPHGARAPSVVTIPGIVIGLASSALLGPRYLFSSALGVIIAGGPLLIVALIAPSALGGGNVKTGGLIGSFVGPPSRVAGSFLIALIAGGLVGAVSLATRRRSMKDAMPFVPFQILGGVIVLLLPDATFRALFRGRI